MQIMEFYNAILTVIKFAFAEDALQKNINGWVLITVNFCVFLKTNKWVGLDHGQPLGFLQNI
jgi:hypothetical protein